MTRHLAFLPAVILGGLLACSATASANGEEFFAPAKNGKVDLVYFGRVKDRQTGRSVTDSVYFLLRDKSTGLSFPFTNDKPGHYRSPDIGTGIKEIGETVDVNAFEIDVNVAGYKKTTITRVPRAAHGTVELDLKLDPVVSGEVTTAGLGAGSGLDLSTSIIVIGFVALSIIVGVARTSGRPWSTKR
jgi:hypothetical protein